MLELWLFSDTNLSAADVAVNLEADAIAVR
jgi:hypothetical protein